MKRLRLAAQGILDRGPVVDLKTPMPIIAQACLIIRTNYKIKMLHLNKRRTTRSRLRKLLRKVRINTIEEATNHKVKGRMRRRTTSLDKDLPFLLSQQLSKT